MTMNDWGLNPSTIGVVISGVVGLGTLVLLVIVYIGAQASRRSAKAAQDSTDVLLKESELRTRPWLGITDCLLLPLTDDLEIHYQNVGVLPAQDTTLQDK